MPDPVKKKKTAKQKADRMRPGVTKPKGRLAKRKPTQTGYGPQNRLGIAVKKKRGGVTKPKGRLSKNRKVAEKTKVRPRVVIKKKNKAVTDKKILAARAAYLKKHGSNSGGTKAQFDAYQANLNKIRKGY